FFGNFATEPEWLYSFGIKYYTVELLGITKRLGKEDFLIISIFIPPCK
ncbi:hypothetical protein HMPREF9514_01085, partial [Enterococcus faecalis TX0855]